MRQVSWVAGVARTLSSKLASLGARVVALTTAACGGLAVPCAPCKRTPPPLVGVSELVKFQSYLFYEFVASGLAELVWLPNSASFFSHFSRSRLYVASEISPAATRSSNLSRTC